MKKKRTAQLAFFSLCAVLSMLVGGAACFIVTGTMTAFFRSEAPAKAGHPAGAGLMFAERVAYQRAIEEVYWRHRIWPKSRSDPKPSLGAVMSQAQLEKKVHDYLRKSQALENYFKRPLTAQQLQAEVDRMTKHTKQPEVLRELFEALENDPFIIAECLARPALAERLLTSLNVHDQRSYDEPKQRPEVDLSAHPAIELATVASLIEPFNFWQVRKPKRARNTIRALSSRYTLPTGIANADAGGGIYNPNTDSWVPTTAVLSGRSSHTAVWTGSEMVLWAEYLLTEATTTSTPARDTTLPRTVGR